MKVRMTADSKRILSLAEAPIANRMIREMKEDESTAADYIKTAIYATGDSVEEVYKAEAEIAKNCRIWNQYAEDSGDIDIWINAEARTRDGFIIIGAYLSDIWQLTGDNGEEIAKYMYIRKFAEVK